MPFDLPRGVIPAVKPVADLDAGSGPIAETALGPVVGVEADDGSRSFRRIPYALPPIGTLRLRPPEPATEWRGVLDGRIFGPVPLQAGGPTGGVAGHEDCLTLNVWVPPGSRDRRPVVVWLFGGGFEFGGAGPPFFDGGPLAGLLDAVVVAPNYRLGSLGYLHLSDVGGAHWAACTNQGLQDQMLALEWIRANAAAFGGDETCITVMGHSAGAFSVGALMATTAVASFDRAVLLSGSCGRVVARDVATAVAVDLLDDLGASIPSDLTALPPESIVAAQSHVVSQEIGVRNLPGGRTWGVVTDGWIVPTVPLQAVADGAAAHIPLLISTTRDEVQWFERSGGESFVARSHWQLRDEMTAAGVVDPVALLSAHYERLDPAAAVRRLRSMFLTDAIYRRPALELARAQAQAGGDAYLAHFTAAPFGPRFGACHSADVALVAMSELPSELAGARDQLIAIWRRFVHSGEPGWPNVQRSGPAPAMDIGGGSRLGRAATEEIRDVWPMRY